MTAASTLSSFPQKHNRYLTDMDGAVDMRFRSNELIGDKHFNLIQSVEQHRLLNERIRDAQLESFQQNEAMKSISPSSDNTNDVFSDTNFVSAAHNSSPRGEYKSSSSSLSSFPDIKFGSKPQSTHSDIFRSRNVSSQSSDTSQYQLHRGVSGSSSMAINEDDDEESWKICGVCSDKATGYHFNALTCEGCKGFFRRSMKNSKTFTCPYAGNCAITKSSRRQCQACRLQKCLRIGMKKECIMSQNQIQQKKSLVISNRIKKVVIEWRPHDLTEAHHSLLRLLTESHVQCNNPPSEKIFQQDTFMNEQMDCSSPASSSSSHSGFSELINNMTKQLASRQPGKFTDAAHVKHFSAIMEFSIKEIIKFCKKIETFQLLSLKDQINLLKSACTEILFIKANYTYDLDKRALTCGPNVIYTRSSFLQGGMSEEYTDLYLKFHLDMALLKLDDTEMAALCAMTLFSADRNELEGSASIEQQQLDIAVALQAYIEQKTRLRTRFPHIIAFLGRLRTLNVLIGQTLTTVKKTHRDDLNQLVLEVAPVEEEGDDVPIESPLES